jgi:2-C-methyl-D-erythritol 4-phosphate cytidylyltransferase
MATAEQGKPNYWAVVPAAGSGTRMGRERPKQYLPLGDKVVLEHTLDALLACPQVDGIVVAVAADDPYWPNIGRRYSTRNVQGVTGGAERCHSVLHALDHLAGQAAARDQVLVHDAARPCVRADDIGRLIDAVGSDGNGGLLALPVADTVKQADASARVAATVDRNRLWRALTPQLFRIDLLRAALGAALDDGLLVTDDAAAMEHAGYRPLLVAGASDNIKITVPADLALAEFFLQQRQLL